MLYFRLVEPSSGELLIDGVDVLNIPLYELRNNIAIVPQVNSLAVTFFSQIVVLTY